MGRETAPCVVAVAGDPGGAEALAPVLERLLGDGRVRPALFPYREAIRLWEARGLRAAPLTGALSRDAARDLLAREQAKALVTGSSVNPDQLERVFIAAARDLGIPSLSILDFWTNYRRRWADPAGDLSDLPDIIAVMDDRARAEMVAEGFPAERIEVTGQPAFDRLPRMRAGFTRGRRDAVRKGLGLAPGEAFVLFASQPVSSLSGESAENPLFPGYTERSVIPAVIRALDRIGHAEGRKIACVLRPHPREKAGDLRRWKGEHIRVLVQEGGDRLETAMAADLVTGMTSVLLLEACYLGTPVVSIQPSPRLPDPLPSNRDGLSRAVYSEGEIEPVLQEMLCRRGVREEYRKRLRSASPGGDATARVVQLITGMLEGSGRGGGSWSGSR